MNDKPKKLVLDYSKWRCGYSSDSLETKNELGEGAVRLLNKEGYMCCLGQFSLQLGATSGNILNVGCPMEANTLIPFLVNEKHKNDTELAYDCIKINDDWKTTPYEKIELLKSRLSAEGIELEVINQPD